MPQERYLRGHTFNRVPVLHPVLLYDDCEGAYNWINTGTGAGWVAEFSDTCPYVGNKGLLLRTRPASCAPDDQVTACKRLWLPPNHLGRLQLVVRPVTHNQDLWIRACLLWFDGVQLHSAEIRMDTATRVIQYRDALAGWTTIFTDAFETTTGAWNHLDFYADFLHNVYGYLTFNHQTVNLTGIPVLSAGDASHIHLELAVVLDIQATTQGGCAFDQIILTSETL